MRIALVGSSHSGKTSLAKALHANGWYYANYTDLLKELTATALNAIHRKMTPISCDIDLMTVEDIVADKTALRPFINELGTALGFDKGYGMEHVLAKWCVSGNREPIVWDCVRFEAQAEKLRELGFVMVGLATDAYTLRQRARANGVSEDEFVRQYNWDQANLPEADITIDGTLTTVQQVDILNRLAGVQNGKRSKAA